MKKFMFLSMLLALFVLTNFSTAQNSWENTTSEKGTYLKTILANDTTATTYSSWFTLEDYLATNWSSDSISLGVTGTVPTTGTPKVVLYMQSSFSNSSGFANIDTLASADSTLSSTEKRIYSNYNNRKYPFYRWAVTGQSTNPDSVTVTIKQFIVKP